ncbi:hypothetical protein [Clostridium tyrobutyricum]|uniref:hypothetical protein n=1 Tax=Clostridium tyrobutyricum TaxID=1519 RepID=UPI00057E6E9C|nr:hypothetical protein [Clostridium tyrobutyricum]
MENIKKIYSYTRKSENYDKDIDLIELDKRLDKLFSIIIENNTIMNNKFDKLDKKMDDMDKKIDKLI